MLRLLQKVPCCTAAVGKADPASGPRIRVASAAPTVNPAVAEEAVPNSGVQLRVDLDVSQSLQDAATGTNAARASARVPPRPPAPAPWVRPGYGAGKPRTRATTVAPRQGPPTDLERGARKPTAREALEGPGTITDALEEQGRAPETGERITSRAEGPKRLTPRQAESIAGKEIERGKVQEFANRNPRSEVIANANFPEWLRKLFPRFSSAVAAGPDAVAVDKVQRKIKVFDSTGSRNDPHIAKTKNYVEQIRDSLPDAYKGYTVEWEESYWTHGEKNLQGK